MTVCGKPFKVRRHWFWDSYSDGTWEPQTIDTFKRFIRPGCTYVDIGAWVGCTVMFAKVLGCTDIHAVEANPKNAQLLRETLALNASLADIRVDQVCVSDRDDGEVTFWSGREYSSSGHIVAGGRPDGYSWKVRQRTLSSLLGSYGIGSGSQLFVKIDIEGGETRIVRDLLALSRRSDTVVHLSLHPPFIDGLERFCPLMERVLKSFRDAYDSSGDELDAIRLTDMLRTKERFPVHGTSHGNFFEITLVNPKAAAALSGCDYAFCYVTDGRSDPEMREWSRASIRKTCGDVPVFTCTADGLDVRPHGNDRVLDISAAFHRVFGIGTKAADRCLGNKRFPKLLHAKFALPFDETLSQFRRIIALDDDIEVFSSGFAELGTIELADGADVGLVPSQFYAARAYKRPDLAMKYRDSWCPDATYYSTGVVVMDVERATGGYRERIRRFPLFADRGLYFSPEEFAANFFLGVSRIDPVFHVIPEIRAIRSPGFSGDDLAGAYALHYGGKRKDVVRPFWRARYMSGASVSPSSFMETV